MDTSAFHWASDVLAHRIAQVGIRNVFFTAGSSFRGLFDSLGALAQSKRPAFIPCLHEEHAVSMAHGAAKVSGQPALVLLHSNVGLLHAAMALYNAYCDRVPMLVIGATGPVDAAGRRPWIDWIHTMGDQGAVVRSFVKWDDQPGSVEAAVEAIDRGITLSCTTPSAPVLVTLDSAMLEESLQDTPSLARSHPRIDEPAASSAAVRAIADELARATSPLILAGRVSRDSVSWQQRIDLAEILGAGVITDLRVGAAFPSNHPLHVGSMELRRQNLARVGPLIAADVILSLDWVDVAGLRRQWQNRPGGQPRIISISADEALHNGGTRDHQAFANVDHRVVATPDQLVGDLLSELRRRGHEPSSESTLLPNRFPARKPDTDASNSDKELAAVAKALRRSLGARRACLVRVPLGWTDELWDIEGPLDYLGFDGGAGLGSGPGMAVGAAIALRGSDRLPVAVIGDGDCSMGMSALWSAARCRVGLLLVVINNGGYMNEHAHQIQIARHRRRTNPLTSVGSSLSPPPIDLPGIARAQGFVADVCESGYASVSTAIGRGVEDAVRGRPVMISVTTSVRIDGADERGPSTLPTATSR